MPNPRSTLRSFPRLLAVGLALASTPALLAKGPDPEPLAPSNAAAKPMPAAIELRTEEPKPITLPAGAAADRRPLGRAEAAPIVSAPAAGTSGAGGLSLSRTTLALGGVLGLIFVIAAIVKRIPRGGALGAALVAAGRAPSGVIEVLGRFTLSRGVTLILLKVDRRVVLISQTGQRSGASLSTLCEMADADEVASILAKCRGDTGESIAARFQSTLARADRTMTAAQPVAPRRAAPSVPTTDSTQVSAALRARLAAMRANDTLPKRVAA